MHKLELILSLQYKEVGLYYEGWAIVAFREMSRGNGYYAHLISGKAAIWKLPEVNIPLEGFGA